MSGKNLILNLKKEYFNEIKAGIKKYEYRLNKKFWEKRLSKSYDYVEIRLGYPKSDDKERILLFKWDGFEKIMLTHKEFGSEPVEVFAISLLNPVS